MDGRGRTIPKPRRQPSRGIGWPRAPRDGALGPASHFESRSKWIEEGLKALAAGGPDAVRIDPLAKTLGVTRGGFYWPFDDRHALLEEMLDTWERVVIDDVIERVESEGGDARAKLRRLVALVSTMGDLLKVELAIRDWGRRDNAVAKRLRRVDNRRMDYMRALFGEFLSRQ